MPDKHPIALKIDVDTHAGMRDGVPVLLDLLEKHCIKATFCLSMGPDNSGRAVFRLFRDPAFLKKMLSTGAPALYGWRTILSGTLLPSRPIATAFPGLVRDIVKEGHEAVVHAWNHRFWQDHLPEMSKAQIRQEFQQAFSAYESILSMKPRAVAAPGWQATSKSIEVEGNLGLEWASDLRNGPPCFLRTRHAESALLQIPTTGPCIEELLTEGIRDDDEISRHLVSAQRTESYPVLAVHAEVEGGPYRQLLDRLIPVLLEAHGKIITIGEMARGLLAQRQDIPLRDLTMTKLPGRAGTVASSKQDNM